MEWTARLCPINGKLYRSLKRHLSANCLTPDEYRHYSAKRSALAKTFGLGRAHTAKAAQAKPRKTLAPKA